MFHDSPSATVEIASIGWEGEADYVFPGDDSNDGHTLVRVQLFSGRDPTQPLNPNRAQGTKLIAHLNSLAGFKIPNKDARCYLAVPPGMTQVPGAAIIVGVVEPSKAQLDNLKPGEQGPATGAGATRIIQRDDGTAGFFTTDDGTLTGKSVYLTVGSDALTFVAPWGTLTFDAAGFRILTASGASLGMGGIGLPAPLDAIGSYVNLQAGTVAASCSAASFGSGAVDALAGTQSVKTALQGLQQQINLIATAIEAMATAALLTASAPIASGANIAAACATPFATLATGLTPLAAEVAEAQLTMATTTLSA